MLVLWGLFVQQSVKTMIGVFNNFCNSKFARYDYRKLSIFALF